MSGLLKGFGKGILYLFTLPLLIVVLAFYSVIGLFSFLFMFFKSVVLFFTGRSLNDDLPEDKKAKEILNRQAGNFEEAKQPVVEEKAFSVYQPTVDPFSTKESTTNPYQAAKNEEQLPPKEEVPVIEEQPQVEEQIQREPDPLPEPVNAAPSMPMHEISTDEESKYKPLGSDDFLMDFNKDEFEDDDNSDDSGISFDSF